MSRLETRVQRRRTGKTSEVISMMKNDPKALLIIHLNAAKQAYPRELHPRIFSARSFLNGRADGMDFNKVIIDEGFIINQEDMARLYYELGLRKIPTLAIGSLSPQPKTN